MLPCVTRLTEWRLVFGLMLEETLFRLALSRPVIRLVTKRPVFGLVLMGCPLLLTRND